MRTALLIVGHGSTTSPEPSRSVQAVARILRPTPHRFDAVEVAFWKGEPSSRSALRSLDAHRVVVVPMFLADGYFGAHVVPRELGLQPLDEAGRFQSLDGQWVAYAPPIGVHPQMRHLVAQLADQTLARAGLSESASRVIVVGHGTRRNPESRRAVQELVEALRADSRDALAAFIDDDPELSSVADSTPMGTPVVVVPFMSGRGSHVVNDIPGALGLPVGEAPEGTALALAGRTVVLGPPIGSEAALMADLVARSGEQMRASLEPALAEARAPDQQPLAGRAHAALAELLREVEGWLQLGQVIVRETEGGFELRHGADRDHAAAELQIVSARQLEHIAETTASAHFRPLKTTRDLRRGWRVGPVERRQLRIAVECLYPGAIVDWFQHQRLNVAPVELADVLERQTGAYGSLRDCSTDARGAGIAELCDARCARRIVWERPGGAAEPEVGSLERELVLPCMEACRMLLARLRAQR